MVRGVRVGPVRVTVRVAVSVPGSDALGSVAVMDTVGLEVVKMTSSGVLGSAASREWNVIPSVESGTNSRLTSPFPVVAEATS